MNLGNKNLNWSIPFYVGLGLIAIYVLYGQKS